MKVGLIKEIKVHEYRVGLTPDCVGAYTRNGHTVFVEKDAGVGAGFSDAQYEEKGGTIVADAQKIFDEGFGMIDCQTYTPHLQSLGAVEVERTVFLKEMKELIGNCPSN